MQADAAAFTLGKSGAAMRSLTVTDRSLTIRLLVDDHGNITAANATVEIDGTGQMQGTGEVAVTVRSQLLFQNVAPTAGGANRWLIVGYPSASVDVRSPGATASPGAGTASPGASP